MEKNPFGFANDAATAMAETKKAFAEGVLKQRQILTDAVIFQVEQLNSKASELVTLIDERTRPSSELFRNVNEILVSIRTYGSLLIIITFLLGVMLHHFLTPDFGFTLWQQSHLLKIHEKLQRVLQGATDYLHQTAHVGDWSRQRNIRVEIAHVQSGKDLARETMALLDSWYAESEKRGAAVKFRFLGLLMAVFLSFTLNFIYDVIQLEGFVGTIIVQVVVLLLATSKLGRSRQKNSDFFRYANLQLRTMQTALTDVEMRIAVEDESGSPPVADSASVRSSQASDNHATGESTADGNIELKPRNFMLQVAIAGVKLGGWFGTAFIVFILILILASHLGKQAGETREAAF